MLVLLIPLVSAASIDYFRYFMVVNQSSGTTTQVNDYYGRVNWTVNGTMNVQSQTWGGRSINLTNSTGGDHLSFLQTRHQSSIWPLSVSSFTKGCFVILSTNATTQQLWSSPYYTTGNNRSEGLTTATNPFAGLQESLGGATTGNTTNSNTSLFRNNVTYFVMVTWDKAQRSGTPVIYLDGSNRTGSTVGRWTGDLHYSTLDRWLMDYHSGTTREFLLGSGLGECFELNFSINETQAVSMNSSLKTGNIAQWIDAEFASADSCSYSGSGDYYVNNQCNFSSPINLNGNAMIINTTSIVNVSTRIFNYSYIRLPTSNNQIRLVPGLGVLG